jgi:hypothetical protein
MVIGFDGCLSSSVDTSLPSTGSMSATINGISWATTSPPGSTAVLYKTSGIMIVTGENVDENGDISTIAFTLSKHGNTTDSLGIRDTAEYIPIPPNGGAKSRFITGSTAVGWVTISQYDTAAKTLAGTFSFNATNTSGAIVTITNGVFSKVPWTIQ